jgi:hypothetical protein
MALTTDGNAAISPSPVCLTSDPPVDATASHQTGKPTCARPPHTPLMDPPRAGSPTCSTLGS